MNPSECFCSGKNFWENFSYRVVQKENVFGKFLGSIWLGGLAKQAVEKTRPGKRS